MFLHKYVDANNARGYKIEDVDEPPYLYHQQLFLLKEVREHFMNDEWDEYVKKLTAIKLIDDIINDSSKKIDKARAEEK